MYTKTDREFLMFAAKAAEFKFGIIHDEPRILCDAGWTPWNPLQSDGDAFRLAVKLRIDVVHDNYDPGSNNAFVMAGNIDHVEYVNVESSRKEATRRAIVRAAAEIGKGMK